MLGTVLVEGVSGGHARTSFRTESLGHLSRLDSVAEPGQVVFLGSSTFHALDVGSVADRSLNLSIGGDTVEGLVERMRGYRSIPLARGVVVNIGLNDLIRGRSAEEVPLDDLFQAIPAAKPVVLLGVQMVAGAALERRPGLSESSARLNARFAQACGQRHACTFVENPADGTPAGNAMVGADGIHLSPDGYAALRARLRMALTGIGQEANR